MEMDEEPRVFAVVCTNCNHVNDLNDFDLGEPMNCWECETPLFSAPPEED